MKATPPKLPLQNVIEYGFTAVILGGLVYAAWYLYTYHYLPQPYFYEPSGTFMDWFSLTRWAHVRGAYDIEGTIYPPLSFVIMRGFSIASCYKITHAEEVRDSCDWLGVVAQIIFLIFAIVVTYWTFWKCWGRSGLVRATALSFGFPVTYGFERGNFIILCYAFTLLAYGPVLRSARLRWLFAGMAVNLKVYMIAIVAAPLLRRKWVTAEGMVLATLGVYLLSLATLGEGTPKELVDNLQSYSAGFGANTLLDLWFPSSYTPLRTLLTSPFLLEAFLDSRQIEGTLIGLQLFVGCGQLLIICAAAATWFRPEVVSGPRIAFLALSLALCTSEASGYTECMLISLIFMERWKGTLVPIAITIGYILNIPLDYVLGYAPPLVRTSYLGGDSVIVQYGVGVLSLLRPGLSLLMAMLLSIATIIDVWRDIRLQGWSSRWRFRHDWAPFASMVRPLPPTSVERKPE